ncbi:MAG: MazG-like family protein [Pseudomonadota bacterium]
MDKIYDLTKADPKSLQERALKLAEEAGELAQAVLSVTRAPGSTYKNHSLADVREEAVDAAIVSLSLLAHVSDSREDFEAQLDRLMTLKCAKWSEKLEPRTG